MWFWLISSIAGSILGGAADSWFADTKLGKWFYKKIDGISTWAVNKLGIQILKDEENWKRKYPNIAKYLHTLEKRIVDIENKINK